LVAAVPALVLLRLEDGDRAGDALREKAELAQGADPAARPAGAAGQADLLGVHRRGRRTTPAEQTAQTRSDRLARHVDRVEPEGELESLVGDESRDQELLQRARDRAPGLADQA